MAFGTKPEKGWQHLIVLMRWRSMVSVGLNRIPIQTAGKHTLLVNSLIGVSVRGNALACAPSALGSLSLSVYN